MNVKEELLSACEEIRFACIKVGIVDDHPDGGYAQGLMLAHVIGTSEPILIRYSPFQGFSVAYEGSGKLDATQEMPSYDSATSLLLAESKPFEAVFHERLSNQLAKISELNLSN